MASEAQTTNEGEGREQQRSGEAVLGPRPLGEDVAMLEAVMAAARRQAPVGSTIRVMIGSCTVEFKNEGLVADTTRGHDSARPSIGPIVLTTDAVAKQLHCSAAAVARLCATNKLPGATRPGRAWHIPVDAVSRYLGLAPAPQAGAAEQPATGAAEHGAVAHGTSAAALPAGEAAEVRAPDTVPTVGARVRATTSGGAKFDPQELRQYTSRKRVRAADLNKTAPKPVTPVEGASRHQSPGNQPR